MFQGSLWTRANSPVWQNVFARLQQDQGRLLIFPDERAAQQSAQQPLQVVPLRGSEVSEFGMASGGRFFERALRIRGGQETDGNSAFGLVSPAGEHIFAAEDGVAHAAWQRHLVRAATGCSAPEPPNGKHSSVSQQRKRARATSLFGPSPLVVMRLCCAGREFGKQLLQRLKAARRAFEEGLRDLTVVADKARLAQKGLYDVDSLLISINRTLADSHPLENQSESDAEALVWCRDWVSGLQAFIMNLDHQVDTMLQREAAAQLPGNWCTFAQNCVMQLRDLEDAMQVGQSQWRKLQAAAEPGTPLVRRCTTPRARMPYTAHWARATAI